MKLDNQLEQVDVQGTGGLKGRSFSLSADSFGMIYKLLSQYSDPIGSVLREYASNCDDAHTEARLIPDMGYGEMVLRGLDGGYYPRKSDVHEAEDLGKDAWWLPVNYLTEMATDVASDPSSVEEVEGTLERWKTDAPLQYQKVTRRLDKVKRHFERWDDTNYIVRLTRKISGTDEIVFEDFGVGLSPYRVANVFARFLSSTKRGGNAEIGAFGLGAKSGFGYTDAFTVRARWMGVETTYAMHRSSEGPKIVIIGQEPTNEPNGTTVSVPIKKGDAGVFEASARKQLAYFSGVSFEGIAGMDGEVIQGKHFAYHTGTPYSGIHLKIGKVSYPLDTSKIPDLNGYNYQLASRSISLYPIRHSFPIALRFEVGELPVVWARENIEYTQEAIATIAARTREAFEELARLQDETTSKIDSLEEYIRLKSDSSSLIPLPGGHTIPTGGAFKTQVKYARYGHIKLDINVLDWFWECTFKIHSDGRRSNSGSIHTFLGDGGLYYYPEGGVIRNRTISYLQNEEGEDEIYTLRRKPIRARTASEFIPTYVGVGLKLSEIEAKFPREMKLIRALEAEAVALIEAKAKDWEAVVVPDDWEDPRYVAPTSTKSMRQEGKIPVKFGGLYNDTLSWRMEDSWIKSIIRHKGPLIVCPYDKDEEAAAEVIARWSTLQNRLPKLENYLCNRRTVMLKLSQKNIELIKEVRSDALLPSEFLGRHARKILRQTVEVGVSPKIDLEVAQAAGLDEYAQAWSVTQRNRNLAGNWQAGKFRRAMASLGYTVPDSDPELQRVADTIKAYEMKYPLLKVISSGSGKECAGELKAYVKSKGEVNPHLLYRLYEHKTNQPSNEANEHTT